MTWFLTLNIKVVCLFAAQVRVQGHQVPPLRAGLRDPGRRHCQLRRHRGQVHLRGDAGGRAHRAQTPQSGLRGHGTHAAAQHGHQPVLHHLRPHPLARRLPRRIRQGHRGNG